MNCPSSEQLAAYLDGALEAPERATLQEHIEGCTECLEIVSGLLAFEREEGSMGEDVDLDADSKDQADETRQVAHLPPPNRSVPWTTTLPIAAGVILAVGTAFVLLRPAQSDPPITASGLEAAHQDPSRHLQGRASETSRGTNDPGLKNQATNHSTFRLGGGIFLVRLFLEAEETDHALVAFRQQLEPSTKRLVLSPAATRHLDELRAALEDGSESALDHLGAFEKSARRILPSTQLDLGRWIESASWALANGDASVARSKHFREVLVKAKSADLEPEIGQVERLLNKNIPASAEELSDAINRLSGKASGQSSRR